MRGTQSRPGSSDSDDNDKKPSADTPEASSSAAASSSGAGGGHKNLLAKLPSDVLNQEIIGRLSFKEQQRARGVNKFFKQTIDKDRLLNVEHACRFICYGQPKELLTLLSHDPELFFHPYPVAEDASEGQFFNVTPCKLLYFLCDKDMWEQVKVFAAELPEEARTPFMTKWNAQQTAMGRGGADMLFLKGDREPTYADCLERTDTFNAYGENLSCRRRLLKNPEGIVCWEAPNNQVRFYYVNQGTHTIDPLVLSDEAHQAAYAVFRQMEPNTAKRSSNDEHALFQTCFRHPETNNPLELIREGIEYERDGIKYRDTHHDFNRLTNADLRCIRLCQAADREPNPGRQEELYSEANRTWRSEHGHFLKALIWLLQRYCEKNRSFYLFSDRPDYFDKPKFLRILMIYNWITDREELVFDVKSGTFHDDFGGASNSGFSIYKGALWRGVGGAAGRWRPAALSVWRAAVVIDLIAANRLTVDASNVVERPIDQPVPDVELTLNKFR